MDGKIELVIARPGGVYKNVKANKVLLPAMEGNITILPQRAPIVLQLKAGNVQILDESGQAKDEYYIAGGYADVAEDRCVIAAPSVQKVQE